MRSSESDPLVSMELRGTISRAHPAYVLCLDLKPRVAFKTILALSAEAMLTRAGLTRFAVDQHPLKDTLQGMPANEAIAFLLGVTKTPNRIHIEDVASDLTKEPRLLSEKALSPVSSDKPAVKSTNIDEDEFLLLSTSPFAAN